MSRSRQSRKIMSLAAGRAMIVVPAFETEDEGLAYASAQGA